MSALHEAKIGGLSLFSDAEGKECRTMFDGPDATMHLKELEGRSLVDRLHET